MMKLTPRLVPSSCFLFAAVVSGVVVSAFDQHRYMGFNATVNDEDIALCGYRLFGCIGTPSTARRCDRDRVIMGSFDDIGTGHQTWKYNQGLLHSNSPSIPFGEDWCLGLRHSNAWSTSTELIDGDTYVVELQTCDTTNTQQRWLFGGDGRIHNMDNYQFCLTVQSKTYAANQAHGSSIVLEQCKEDRNDAKQRFDVKGADVESFVYSDQEEYGYDDIIRVAFRTPSELSGQNTVLKIYAVAKKGQHDHEDKDAASSSDGLDAAFYIQESVFDGEPVANKITGADSSVWNLRASDVLQHSASMDIQYFVVQLGQDFFSRIAFSITPNQEHVVPALQHGCKSGSVFGILIGAFVGLPLVAMAVACLHSLVTTTTKPANRPPMSPVKGSDDQGGEDDQTQASDCDADVSSIPPAI